MAEVPVTINGVICDLYGRTITGPVKIVGSLMRSDLSVGGGPIIPPDKPPSGNPPGIWGGGNEPFPTPPIANVPGLPPMGPDFPPHPPEDVTGGGWEWGWNPTQGWHPVYVPGDKPQPLPPPAGGE